MKSQVQTKKKVWIEKFQHVRYLKTQESTTRKPLADHNGIHCEGDRFGYVVEWQVEEQRPTH